MSSDKTTPPNITDIRAAVVGRTKQIQAEDKTAPRIAKEFLSFGDMLAAPVAPVWLLRDFLEAGTAAELYGESGSMKSFVALDMGLCLASGSEWHGAKVSNPGPVAYVAAEGGQGLRKRMRAWAIEHGINTEIPFYTLPEPTEMLDGPDMDALVAGLGDIAQRHGGLRLVILDTLARTFGAGDENSTRDMSAYVAAMDHLRNTFGCAVLVVHHTGHDKTDRARGSGALKAALDWEYSLEKRGELRVLTCTKSKDHETPPHKAFMPRSVGVGWRDPESGDELTSCVLDLTDYQGQTHGPRLKGANRIALDALRSLATTSSRVHINDWRKEAYRLGVSPSDELKSKQKAFKRAVSGLLDGGHVGVSDDYYWVIEASGGQGRHKGDTSPLSPGASGGQGRHTPLGVSPMSPMSPTSRTGEMQGRLEGEEEA